jgi:dTDP-4-amino-4,6-dideoxygalactose transaminase
VFVDIDPRTYNINPQLIEPAVTKHTKAILPVHLFGQMCDMGPIMEIARQHGLHVIEDAAQAITATYKSRKAGSIGTVGCFSFFPSKNLGGAGDGGMIVTNNEALFQKLVLFRNHGAKPKYFHKYIGGNFRLDPIQAAVLLVKLPHLDDWSDARRRNASYYDRRFRNSAVTTPLIHSDCTSIYNQYVIGVQNRDALITHLKDREIATEIYYPLSMHQQECFRHLGYNPVDCPVASNAAAHTLALPIYPELTSEMLGHVSDSVLSFVNV